MILDGRDIKELTRQFLINWRASKEAKKNNAKNMVIPYPMIGKPQTFKLILILYYSTLYFVCRHTKCVLKNGVLLSFFQKYEDEQITILNI